LPFRKTATHCKAEQLEGVEGLLRFGEIKPTKNGTRNQAQLGSKDNERAQDAKQRTGKSTEYCSNFVKLMILENKDLLLFALLNLLSARSKSKIHTRDNIYSFIP